MAQTKYYNLMLVPDGVENPIGIKIRTWLFKTLVTALVLFFVSVILFFSLYGEILVRASRTIELEKENEVLKKYKYKLVLLERNMKETQKVVSRISSLAGVDFKIPELPPDSVIFAEYENPKPAVIPRSYPSNELIPEGLPVEGPITRGFSMDSLDFHPGIDIAGKVGTPILATAAGKVIEIRSDSVYGLMVIIEHDAGISTVYGHNSEILVEKEQNILVGSRIALLGNTGYSTGPHLHYEIRENDKPVNPLKYVTDNEIFSQQE